MSAGSRQPPVQNSSATDSDGYSSAHLSYDWATSEDSPQTDYTSGEEQQGVGNTNNDSPSLENNCAEDQLPTSNTTNEDSTSVNTQDTVASTPDEGTPTTGYTSNEDQPSVIRRTWQRTPSDLTLTATSNPTDYSTTSTDEAPLHHRAGTDTAEGSADERNRILHTNLQPIVATGIPRRRCRAPHSQNDLTHIQREEGGRHSWFRNICNCIQCITLLIMVCVPLIWVSAPIGTILLVIVVLYFLNLWSRTDYAIP